MKVHNGTPARFFALYHREDALSQLNRSLAHPSSRKYARLIRSSQHEAPMIDAEEPPSERRRLPGPDDPLSEGSEEWERNW